MPTIIKTKRKFFQIEKAWRGYFLGFNFSFEPSSVEKTLFEFYLNIYVIKWQISIGLMNSYYDEYEGVWE